jgi:hypothetical protein
VVTLSPADSTDPVGTSRTSTASVSDIAGQRVSGATVGFLVTGADSATGSCTTDTNGQCAFTYTGSDLPGGDLITAWADLNENGQLEAGEPSAVATQAWSLPAGTLGQVTGAGQIPNADHSDNIAFGFSAKSTADGPRGECTVVDPALSVHIKCTNMRDIVRSGAQATLFGDASIDGTPTTYRIDIADNNDPGTDADTFRIHLATGYLAGGTLTHGNIQTH